MEKAHAMTLGKHERICSKTLIQQLFTGAGSIAMTHFPIRLVAKLLPADTPEAAQRPPAMLLVSVPKRHFKRAVKRNRVKRQLREAFRKNKYIPTEAMSRQSKWQAAAIALIWLDGNLHPSREIEEKVNKLLRRLSEKAIAPLPQPENTPQ